MSGLHRLGLFVAVGKAKGALFVGSHNATLAGFGLNDEITNEFRTSGPGARQGTGVIRAALDYLQGFVPKVLVDVAQVFSAARRNVPWLEGPVAVESDERILLFTTGRDADLWSRLRPFIPKRPALTFVCGPFFDKKLEFLQRLFDDVRPRRLVVGVDPDSVEIDPNVVRKFRGAEFVNVARVLADPEEVPYLVVWKSPSNGTVQEAVRIVPFSETPDRGGLDLGIDWAGSIAIERKDGAVDIIRTHVRALPRNDGRDRLLVCPYCQIPRRGLYGWAPGGRYTHSALRSSWQCRSCAGLRYASEGGALVHRGRGRFARILEVAFGRSRSERPEPWYPHAEPAPTF